MCHSKKGRGGDTAMSGKGSLGNGEEQGCHVPRTKMGQCQELA